VKVGEVLDRLREDGWYLIATKGSHRQFKHAVKPGRVTVAGRPSDDLPPGTLNSIFSKLVGKSDRMRYAIVIEKAPSNYAAYVPDLPGCIATGATVAETESLIREAIEFHLEGLKADGLPVPPANSQVEYIDIAV
jgi:predicted RNA binding protein YcfA (HicA-like mRNA interferase family)/predicted RNase H-like HicB family nuclease